MEALVTKASCQVEKIKAAKDQLEKEFDFIEKACIERRVEIECFFREVRHIFLIREKEQTVLFFLTTY